MKAVFDVMSADFNAFFDNKRFVEQVGKKREVGRVEATILM